VAGSELFDEDGPLVVAEMSLKLLREPCYCRLVLATLDTGAYGMVLASNYNSRPRPAEVLVDGKSAKVIRRRETIADLVRNES
jgi:hypothetical protein